MAEITTTVHSPIGAIYVCAGRLPKQQAFDAAAAHLRRQIRDAEAHLAEIDNWTTKAARGSLRAKTHEEMHQHG